MDLITLLMLIYILLGVIYGYVAVSRLSSRITDSVSTKHDLIVGTLFLLMICLVMWPLYLFDDIKDCYK